MQRRSWSVRGAEVKTPILTAVLSEKEGKLENRSEVPSWGSCLTASLRLYQQSLTLHQLAKERCLQGQDHETGQGCIWT